MNTLTPKMVVVARTTHADTNRGHSRLLSDLYFSKTKAPAALLPNGRSYPVGANLQT